MTAERNPDNAPGAWFTTDDCTSCTLCGDMAPGVFRESDNRTHHIVHSQPLTDEMIALAEEAREACPAEAIATGGGNP